MQECFQRQLEATERWKRSEQIVCGLCGFQIVSKVDPRFGLLGSFLIS